MDQTTTTRRGHAHAEADAEVVPTEVNDTSAAVSEDAACCLNDIDAALAAADEAAADVKPSREGMGDDENLALGDVDIDAYYDAWNLDALYDAFKADGTAESEEAYFAADRAYEAAVARDRALYDAAYERVMGVENHRDCGCGCR